MSILPCVQHTALTMTAAHHSVPLSTASDCPAALQADGLLQRHSHPPVVNEAAAVLVHASKNGPAALQVGESV
jgi:hypothetical protein